MDDSPRTKEEVWVEEFEGHREKRITTQWLLAQHRSESSLIYQVVDGAFSTSVYERSTWVHKVNHRVQKDGLPGTTLAYSYHDYGLHYFSDHTLREIEIGAIIWQTYLGMLQEHQRLISICFSLGSAVALYGIYQWLEDNSEKKHLKKLMPAMVLVAPALEPPLSLYEAYFEYMKKKSGEGQEREVYEDVPAPIRQLCAEGFTHRGIIKKTVDTIIDLGVDIHIVFWPPDQITPYDSSGWPQIREDNEHRVMTNQPLENEIEAVRKHMTVRDDDDTINALIEILRRY